MADDAVLAAFRVALDAAYGDRVERAILFGSRARDDARPDSDYDIAVFLRDFRGLRPEVGPLGVISIDLLDRTGAFVTPLAFPADAYRDGTALMQAIREEGRPL